MKNARAVVILDTINGRGAAGLWKGGGLRQQLVGEELEEVSKAVYAERRIKRMIGFGYSVSERIDDKLMKTDKPDLIKNLIVGVGNFGVEVNMTVGLGVNMFVCLKVGSSVLLEVVDNPGLEVKLDSTAVLELVIGALVGVEVVHSLRLELGLGLF